VSGETLLGELPLPDEVLQNDAPWKLAEGARKVTVVDEFDHGAVRLVVQQDLEMLQKASGTQEAAARNSR
jgi:hypothetical protein